MTTPREEETSTRYNYYDVHDTFPPAYVADERGQFEHSWRVLALPYIDQAPLYSQYRFDEPWDGPHHTQIADGGFHDGEEVSEF